MAFHLRITPKSSALFDLELCDNEGRVVSLLGQRKSGLWDLSLAGTVDQNRIRKVLPLLENRFLASVPKTFEVLQGRTAITGNGNRWGGNRLA